MAIIAANISGSGTLEAVGNTYLGGTLNVTGAVALATQTTGSAAGPASFLAVNTSGVVVLDEPAGGGGSARSVAGDTDNGVITWVTSDNTFASEANLTFDGSALSVTGDVSGSGTLEVVRNTVLGGNLNVSGSVTLGDAAADVTTVTGRLTASQGGYFADRVGIGTATPHSSSILHLSYANAITPPQMIANDTYGGLRIENTNAAGGATIHMRSDDADGFITYHKTQNNRGDFHFHAEPYESALVISSSGDVLVPSGSLSGSSTLEIVGATYLGGALNVTGAVALATQTTGSAAGPSSFLAVNTSGVVILDEPAGGGGGSPGGSDTEVQFNDATSFAGDSTFTFDKTSNVLTVGGLSNAGSTVIDRVTKAVGDSPYTTTATDHYIGLDTSGGAIRINLRAAGTEGVGRVLIIKDETGDAETYNITIYGNASENIDGSNTQVINNGYGSLTLVATNRSSDEWSII